LTKTGEQEDNISFEENKSLLTTGSQPPLSVGVIVESAIPTITEVRDSFLLSGSYWKELLKWKPDLLTLTKLERKLQDLRKSINPEKDILPFIAGTEAQKHESLAFTHIEQRQGDGAIAQNAESSDSNPIQNQLKPN